MRMSVYYFNYEINAMKFPSYLDHILISAHTAPDIGNSIILVVLAGL